MFGDEGGTRHSVRLEGRKCVMYCTSRRIAVAGADDVICDIPLGSVVSYSRDGGRITIVYSDGSGAARDVSVTVRADGPAEALAGISGAVSAFRRGCEGPAA